MISGVMVMMISIWVVWISDSVCMLLLVFLLKISMFCNLFGIVLYYVVVWLKLKIWCSSG